MSESSLTNLVVAFYDHAVDRHGRYLVGVVRYSRFTRHPKTGHGQCATIMENVHFGPVPLIDDLLRPPIAAGGPPGAHVIVAWGASVLAHDAALNAVAPNPGVFLIEPDARTVALYQDMLDEMRLHDATIQAVPQRLMREYVSEPDLEGWRASFLRWREATEHHSTLIPPGTVGIAANSDDVIERLDAKTWDPHQWLAELIEHPNPCMLEDLCEGLGIQPNSFSGTGGFPWSDVSDLWDQGFMWDIVEELQHRLTVLEQLVHVGMTSGARISTNNLARCIDNEDGQGLRPCGLAQSFLSDARSKGGKFKYAIPAGGDWWDLLLQRSIDAGVIEAA